MLTRSIRSRSHGRFLFLLVLVAFLGATGCSQVPRQHWWQFWRKNPATTSAIGPDLTTVPPPPDMLGQSPNGSSLAPGGGNLPVPPGGVTDTDPLRRPAGTTSELRTIHFNYDSDQVSPENVALLDGNAQWLKANPGIQIQIEGHCDERGTTEYNLSLGDRRAKSVKAYMMSKGIEGERLHTTTYGKERPVDPSRSEAAYSKNRRAQFLVY